MSCIPGVRSYLQRKINYKYDKPTVTATVKGTGEPVQVQAVPSVNNLYAISSVTSDIEVTVTQGKKNSFEVTGPGENAGFIYTPITDNPVKSGGSFTFYVKPADGYENPTVTYTTADGTIGPISPFDNNQYKINGIQSDITINVKPGTKNTYSVQLPANNPGYTADVTLKDGKNEFNHGDVVSFTVKEKDGYQVTSVMVNGSPILLNDKGEYTTKVNNSNVIITATAEARTYEVEYIYESSSSEFSVTPGAMTAVYGSAYSFQVTPGAGYGTPSVTYKTGNGDAVPVNGNNGQYTITIKGDTTITITAGSANAYSVNLPTGTGYTAAFDGGDKHAEIAYKTEAKFTVTAAQGYVIESVKATTNGKTTTLKASEENTYTFTVTGDTEVSVTVSKLNYSVTLKAGDDKNGTAYTMNAETTQVAYDEYYTFTVTQGTGYGTPKVTVNGTAVNPSNGSEYRVKITGITTITVEAGAPNTYGVSLPSGTGFTAAFVGNENTQFTCDYDSTVEFTVTPDEGYKITSVKAGESPVSILENGNYSFVVKGATNIEVVVEKILYDVTYKTDNYENAHYTLIQGANKVGHGEYCTFTVAANTGYNAPVVKVADTVINPVNGEYKVLITKNTTIEIETGGIITYDVDLIGGTGFTFNKDSVNVVNYGDKFEFKVIVDKMYNADRIVINVNGTAVNATDNGDGTYTCEIKNVTAPQTVTVTGLVKKTFLITFANEDGYTLSTTGSMNVTAGDSFVFTLTVADSHTGTYKVLANDTIVEAENGTYTIKEVTDNTLIKVTGLKRRTFTANVTADNATVAAVDSEEISYGSYYQFTVTPAEGYKVVSVEVDGTTITPTAGIYTVSNVTRDPQIIVETSANVLTVNYVSTEQNHEHKSTKTFTIKDFAKVTEEVLDGCAIHNFIGWTADGTDLTAEALKNLITAGDDEITLTAKFEIPSGKIDELVSLMQTTTKVITTTGSKYAYKIIFETVANAKVDVTDPCVAEYVKVTGYGSLLANKADANFSSAATELSMRIHDTNAGDRTVRLTDVDTPMFNYYRDSNITLEDVNGRYIELSIDSNNPGALYAAGWMELELGNQRIIIFSTANDTVVISN